MEMPQHFQVKCQICVIRQFAEAGAILPPPIGNRVWILNFWLSWMPKIKSFLTNSLLIFFTMVEENFEFLLS